MRAQLRSSARLAIVSNVVIIHLYINLNDTTIGQHYYVQLLIKTFNSKIQEKDFII